MDFFVIRFDLHEYLMENLLGFAFTFVSFHGSQEQNGPVV